MSPNEKNPEEEYTGDERRRRDRREVLDRRQEPAFTLRMIHELSQRFEQLSAEGRAKVLEYAKTLLLEEMTEAEPKNKE